MATIGSCICGKTRYKVSGKPRFSAACHCLSCRKLSGGAYTVTFMVPDVEFKFDPGCHPKQVLVHHEIGIPLKIDFCGDCGVALCKHADAEEFRGMTIVFSGTLDNDDKILQMAPNADIWNKHRLPWVADVQGGQTMQFDGFPDK